jgi:hypothetical protein
LTDTYSGLQISGQVMVRGVDDPHGAFDIDDDASMDEVNIGCESYHGPGSEHVDKVDEERYAEMAIVNPALLSAERAAVVCGRCHDRRQGVGPKAIAYTQPINAEGHIMPPGESRDTMLKHYSSKQGPKPDAELWQDSIHSKKPHQQYADFLKSGMYRNPRHLVSCGDCHDMHSGTPYRRSLLGDPDNSRSPLCQRCHEIKALPHMEQHLGARMKGLATRCIDCHMPGTAISGGDAGRYGRLIRLPPYATAAEEAASAYWEGHINSHVFAVPKTTNLAVRGLKPGESMPIPYTHSCGRCHDVDELPHK